MRRFTGYVKIQLQNCKFVYAMTYGWIHKFEIRIMHNKAPGFRQPRTCRLVVDIRKAL